MLRRFCTLVLVLASLVRPSVLSAQAGRPLTGTVLDPDSKAVVNAAVLIRNERTGETVTTTTDGSGRFSIATLSSGTYAIEVFVPGFETVRRTGVQVGEGSPSSVSIQLSVANISE